MTRLPTVGGDTSAWGTILNQFLQAGHNATGTNSNSMTAVNVTDDAYGADKTGAADSTTAITAAIAAVASGGTVFFPAGTYKYSSLTLSGKTDVSILGAGSGTILAPTSGNTAITISGCRRCSVFNLQIDGSLHSGATGISITGDFDGQFSHLNIHDLSGDAVYVNGDDAIGSELHFSHVVTRSNGGWGYNYERTTTTDHGGVYMTDFQAINNVNIGAGGFKISSTAGSTAAFHFLNHCAIDGYSYSTGPALSIHNMHDVHMTRLWVTGLNAGGPILQVDGSGFSVNIDGGYILNSSSAASSYSASILDTMQACAWDDVIFDCAATYCLHGASGLNNIILGQHVLSQNNTLTDTPSYIFARPTFSVWQGPQTIMTPGNSHAQCFSIDDPAHPGNQKSWRNVNGSLQLANTAFNQVILRVDDGGFVLAGGGIMPSGNTAGACTLYSGSGAPGSGLGAQGDCYFRSDTPSTSNQRIYIKTGSSTWTGIV